jgi:HSP20 family protein
MAERGERAVSRWDPFADLDVLGGWGPLRELARGARAGSLLDEWLGRSVPGVGRVVPAIDVTEDEKRYRVSAELPGIKKEGVTVELQEGVLTIRGEKREERDEKNEHRRYVERSYGTFCRSFTLPPDADGDRIQASFEDGVLTLEIPKAEQRKPRTVDIKSKS